MAETLADDFSSDDRRRVVGAGVRHGRDVQIEAMRATADVSAHERDVDPWRPAGSASSSRVPLLGPRSRDPRHSSPRLLVIVEINADERIVALVSFDLDDFEAAIAELDARYLAGEAAAHAHTWSVIARRLRGAQPARASATTPDFVSIDHRRGAAFAPGDVIEYLRAGFDLDQDIQNLHRGCASAQRPRSGRHPCGAWDLARGLRRRVARASTFDGRR